MSCLDSDATAALTDLPDRLEKDAGTHLQIVQEGQKQVDVEALDGEFLVQRGLGAEYADQLQREALEDHPRDDRDGRADAGAQKEGLFHAVKFPRAVVEADDRLAAAGDADAHRERDHAHLHAQAECGQRDVRPVFGERAVLRQQVVGDKGHHGGGEVIEAARKAEARQPGGDGPIRHEGGLAEADVLELEQVGDVKEQPHKLGEDGRQGCALDAPVEHEDKEGVQDGIQDRADHHGEHRVAGAAVCADGGVDDRPDDHEGEADHNDAPIPQRIGHDVVGRAEQAAQRRQKDKGQDRVQHADDAGGDDGRPHAPGRFFGVPLPEVQAEKGGEAVAER